MNKTVIKLILNEVKKPNDRVEKQLAALRLKRARQKLPPEEANKPVVENLILKANYETIYKHIAINGDSKKRAEAQRAIASVYANGLLNKTPLAEISLKTFLGAGSFAVAYEDNDGHVIKCGELRPGNSTEKAFYRKYLKKPSKNFIVHYYKTFKTSDCEMYLAITNKFLTFYEYAQFIIASKSNQRTYTMDRYGYPSFLSAITSEIDFIRKDLVHALPKVRNTFPTVNLTSPVIYKTLSENAPQVIKDFYDGLLSTFGLGSKDAYKILTEIIKVYCTQVQPDISFNNVGANITAGVNNPSFFFFDP